MQKYPNIFRTLWINIRLFGLRKGLKLPIYIYSRTKIYNLGRVEFKCPLQRGIWRIGINSCDSAHPYTIINNMGVVEIHGRTYLNHGSRLTNRGTIVFHGNDRLSHNIVLDIRERLEFGKNVSVGFASEFMDSDIHYMIDVETKQVWKNTAPIYIGNYNWLGNHTFVKKGAKTPDHTIVASPNALIAKDYSDLVPEYSILGGAPAKIIGKGKQRIMKPENERLVCEALKESDKDFIQVDCTDIDEFCAL